jgi:hypothetical protein
MKISEMSLDDAISAGVELEWAKTIYYSLIVKAVESNDPWLSKAETKNQIAEIASAYEQEDTETYVDKVLQLRWDWFAGGMKTFTF